MTSKTIYITDNDMRRLRELIMVARQFKKEEEKYLQDLEAELNRGKIIKSQDIPQDIITMSSEVHLRDLNTKEEITYQLVFPDQADASQGRVSILAPIGTALLGYSVGDIIEWKVPAGVAKLQVEKIIYQPEANGEDLS
ncbi:transcription elongation factor GreAB [Candidatus Velamenicoccus archaeovorus]|jgi:regulator of nucleoside diphosphate kinase|uniref:Transcription elongation factor GreAB n=1 Tax=Velamenicoccus archaeovorus TaxID=1930593 RepID=A0A410P3Q7_VELA1|nr:nucleoside diphosphate kinase regulator [Candidatus Velamenicoccus archaeovorus]QAT16742.1 transcription elongation factor GreAB [Candidatus Velamenicoccus archaeovorus]